MSPETKTAETKAIRFPLLPPHVLLAAILLILALDRWLPLRQLWGNRYLGGTLIVVALATNIYCALQFRRHQTTIIPFRESSALLTKGLYRVTRNPIYVSMVALLVGLAIAVGSLSPWLVPPAFAGIISARFIRREEAMLTDTFGDDYRKYCSRVRRWL